MTTLPRPNRTGIILLCLVLFSCQKDSDAINTALPELQGFGSITRGGEGQSIVHVTNLNATGPGSLHDAIGSDRTIVFDVAGTIGHFRWDSSNEFPVSNLTIDGFSAPSPGITLDNDDNGDCLSFQDGCHDIIVKNIRVRNAGNDGFNVVSGYNMVFDHISVSGSGDGNFDITQGAYNITVQYSIIGSGRPNWSGAMLIAYEGTKNISVHHNLFNSRNNNGAGERNPYVHCSDNINTDNFMLDFRCNVVWNWGKNGGSSYGFGTGLDYGATANIVNNFYQTNGSQASNAVEFNHNSSNARGYVSGNVCGNGSVNPNSISNHALWVIPSYAVVKTESACEAASLVLSGAGCLPRDATDNSFIKTVSLSNSACH